MVTATFVSNGYQVVTDAARIALGGIMGPGEDRLRRGGVQRPATAREGNTMCEIGILYNIYFV